MTDSEEEENREIEGSGVDARRQAVPGVDPPPHAGALESQSLSLKLAQGFVGGGQAGPSPDPGHRDPDPGPQRDAAQDPQLNLRCAHEAGPPGGTRVVPRKARG
jgi:hypothetical protein